jgi:glyoxylate reductase
VLVPTVTDRDRQAAVLSQAGPQLKLIANFGTGVDNIDLDTARQRGITVTNTPGVLTEDTADMTMALILAVPRRAMAKGAIGWCERQVAGWSPTWMLGAASTASGSASSAWAASAGVARRAKAFGLQIHYHNRRRCTARSSASSRRPTGRASTRCWRAWTSSRSTARTRRRPSTCCRRGASS